MDIIIEVPVQTNICGRALAKRESEAMLSHHGACSRMATATCSGRKQNEDHLKHCGRRPPPLYTSTRPHARFGLLSLFVVLVSWTALFGTATASGAKAHGDRRGRSAPLPVLFDDIAPAWEGASLILVDTRPPPVVPPLMPPLRHDEDPTATSSAPPSKRSLTTDPNASDGDFEVPKPFDSAMSNNFTNNCADFFKKLLTSDAITTCHPFSLLLQVRQPTFPSLVYD